MIDGCNADAFGYNARGEIVSATIARGSPSPATASCAYEAASRLASVASNGLAVATFAYDAQGRRIRKKVSREGTATQKVDYTWDGWLLVRETVTDLSTPGAM